MGKPKMINHVIWHTDPNIPDSLKTHIFKPYLYWMAGRYVYSDPDNSIFSVRYVLPDYVFGHYLCYGYSDSFHRYGGIGSVRPVVVLESGVQLTEYTQNGYNWKVDQN